LGSCYFHILAWKQPAHEKIGVVDSQWIVHQSVPSLGSQVNSKLFNYQSFKSSSVKEIIVTQFFFQQGQAEIGRAPWEGVCKV